MPATPASRVGIIHHPTIGIARKSHTRKLTICHSITRGAAITLPSCTSWFPTDLTISNNVRSNTAGCAGAIYSIKPCATIIWLTKPTADSVGIVFFKANCGLAVFDCLTTDRGLFIATFNFGPIKPLQVRVPAIPTRFYSPHSGIGQHVSFVVLTFGNYQS